MFLILMNKLHRIL